MNPDEIFTAICERFEAIRDQEQADMATKRKAYRRLKLRQALRADAEFKGLTVTELELDHLTDSLLSD
jgi:hypothetical protein